jgi:hypothetical protein
MNQARTAAGPATLQLLGLAGAVVATWQVLFVLVSSVELGGGDWARVVLPPLAAAAVPVALLTLWGWWTAPWMWRWSSPALVVPLVLIDLLMVAQAGSPGPVILAAFVVTGLSEELLARGVVQELLRPLAAVPQVLVTAALPATAYYLGLTVLDADRSLALHVAGMVFGFGVAHAAIRRRGTPVLVLGLMNALVVWPQFAFDGFEPITLVATVIAFGYGLWMAAEDPG